ncbi:MAG: DUF2513 domain-containing protein [Planctomycetota bacterium]
MKRDLDLCRQLLADIEAHGTDTTVTALRPGLAGEADERIRYHIRLLIDEGLTVEVDRSAGGVPCVRLTNAGHELLELSHDENLWREAKWAVAQRTGGQSLAVIRSVLARWAYEAATVGGAWRPRRLRRPVATTVRRVEPRYRFERDTPEADSTARYAEPFRFASPLRRRSPYLERFDWRAPATAAPLDWRDAAERDAYYAADTAYAAVDGLTPETYREGVYGEGLYRDAYSRDPLHRDPLYRDPLYRDPLYRERLYRYADAWSPDGPTLPIDVV